MGRTCGHSAGPSIRAARGLHSSSNKWTEHLSRFIGNMTSQENQSCYRSHIQGLRQRLEHRSALSTASLESSPTHLCTEDRSSHRGSGRKLSCSGDGRCLGFWDPANDTSASQQGTLRKCVDHTNPSSAWILHTRSPDFCSISGDSRLLG